MSKLRKAAKQGVWLASFKFASQLFSWIVTFYVANLLVPSDYGLMEMATILTVYGEKFSELGLGAAIIQREEPTKEQLSSVFWFSCVISVIFAIGCFFTSYLTAFIFNEPRVIPITQLVSVIFVINGLQVVPANLLQKAFSFKKIGFIELVSVVISSIAMLIFAEFGFGVWTLIWGRIVNGISKLVLVYSFQPWRPTFHYHYNEARSYFLFGSKVAVSRTFYYLYEKSDNFLVGKFWPPGNLGCYMFAKQLSKIPTDRIIGLVRQVSFPLLSSVKNDTAEFNRIYLKIIAMLATLSFPVFVGGFLVGEDLVKLFLATKWYPMIPLFKYLCLVELISSIISINNLVHLAKGRPDFSLYFSVIRAVIMAVSFYFAVRYSFLSVLIPWYTSYILISVGWILFTLNQMELRIVEYLKHLFAPFIAVVVMTAIIFAFNSIFQSQNVERLSYVIVLLIKIGVGGFFYLLTLWFANKEIFDDIRILIKNKG